MTAESDLSAHFTTLGLPEAAKAWLLDLWNLIQVMDDARDGDRASPGDVDRAVKAIFLTMPLNDFYRQFPAVLQPVMVLAALKWEAANEMEAKGLADEKSYMARAGFYDVVLMTCHLCGIENVGHAVMEMYGDRYEDYIREQRAAHVS